MDLVIRVPGRWSSAPTIDDVVVDLLPRDAGMREACERLGAGRLTPSHLEALDVHTGIARARRAGGSPEAAWRMLQAGAALLRLEGAVVMVDSSGLPQSKEEWLDLAGRPGYDGIFYAFVGIEASGTTAVSRGMAALGLPDGETTAAPGDSDPGDTLKGFLFHGLCARPTLGDGDLYCRPPTYGPVYQLTVDAPGADHQNGLVRLLPAGPTPVVGLSDVVAVSAGRQSLALRADGSVWVWGRNHVYHPDRPYSHPRPVPVDLPGPAVALSAGGEHSLVLLADGSVVSFGANRQGQLGDGSTVPSEIAVRVEGLHSVIAVAAGYDHSLALLADGSLASWGANARGQLGDGTRMSRSTPAPVPALTRPATAIAAGGQSLALLSDGTVAVAGYVPGDVWPSDGSDTSFRILELAAPATAVDCAWHGLAVLADGAVAAWGSNVGGQLGDGSRDDRSAPTVVSGLDSRAVAVAAGHAHSLALLDTGAVVSWDDAVPEPTPVPVHDVVAVSAGISLSLALTGQGHVVAWGSNLADQLGAGAVHVGPSAGEVPPPPSSPRAMAALQSLARLSLRLRSRPESEVRIGGTKLGGRPDLPADLPWPTLDGVPQAFVAQVDQGEITGAARALRPDAAAGAGLVAFFCDSAFAVGGPSFDEVACAVLLTPPGTELVRRDWPPGLGEDWRFREVALFPEAELMDVPVEAWELEHLGLAPEQLWAWAERRGYPEDTRHRVEGYPEPLQHEPRAWRDEVLLLQVDSDDEAGMMWGDLGRLFYLIRADELTAQRLDRTRLVFQCH